MKKKSKRSVDGVSTQLDPNFNLVSSLTPAIMKNMLSNFKAGIFRAPAMLFEQIEERDPVLRSVALKRKLSISSLDYEILQLEDSPESESHAEALRYAYDNLTCVNAFEPDQTGGVSLLLKTMMDCVGKKYAIHEKVWRPSPEGLTCEMRFVPLWFFDAYQSGNGRLQFQATPFASEMMALEEDEWMISVGEGLMVASSINYLYKNAVMTSWLAYCKRNGMPFIKGTTNAAYGSAEWNAMLSSVRKVAEDFAVVTNDGETIEAVDITSRNAPYKELIDALDRQTVTLWRGADLSTLSKDAGVGSNMQQGEVEMLTQHDAQHIAQILNAQFDLQVLKWNFGEDTVPKAYFALKIKENPNHTADIAVDKALMELGIPLSKAYFYSHYGRPEPKDADDTMIKSKKEEPIDEDQIENSNNAINRAYQRKALRIAAEAVQYDLQPVLAELDRILSIENEALYYDALYQMQKRWPQFLDRINENPLLANALEQGMGAAILKGVMS